MHGSSDLERGDLLRPRHGARQGLFGCLAQGRALPSAARRRRRPHQAEARVLGRRRGSALRGDRQGLRDRARPLRDDHARRARRGGRGAHAPDRDRGVRGARRHRPDPLGVDVLPGARPHGGQAVRAPAGGARGHCARRARPRRAALEGVPRGDQARRGRVDALDHAVRRRDRAARGRRGARRGAGRGIPEGARHRRAARRLALGRLGSRALQGHLPRARARSRAGRRPRAARSSSTPRPSRPRASTT